MNELFRKCTFNICWSEKDQEWIGTCEQFKSLSYLDNNLHDAASGIFVLVGATIEDMTANGEPMPWTVMQPDMSDKGGHSAEDLGYGKF